MQIPNRLNNIQQVQQRLRQDEPQSTNASEPVVAPQLSEPTSVAGEALRELRTSPNLRWEVIERARERLSEGEYLTAAAAVATANALLNAE